MPSTKGYPPWLEQKDRDQAFNDEEYYFEELRGHSFSKTQLIRRCEIYKALNDAVPIPGLRNHSMVQAFMKRQSN